MNAREAKRQIKIKEWKELILARESSGLSIEKWCKQNNVSRDRYFYWQRIIRNTACENMLVSTDRPELQEYTSEGPEFARITLAPENHTAGEGISIRIRDLSVDISPTANNNHVRMVLEAITHA